MHHFQWACSYYFFCHWDTVVMRYLCASVIGMSLILFYLDTDNNPGILNFSICKRRCGDHCCAPPDCVSRHVWW